MNPWTEKLDQIYRLALEKLETAAAGLKIGDGMFGMGRKLSDEACHMELLSAVGTLMAEMSQGADPQEVFEAVKFVLERPESYKKVDRSIYWTMIAAHGLTEPAIGCLDPNQAGDLCKWYEKENPKRTRLPVQDAVVKALKKRMK